MGQKSMTALVSAFSRAYHAENNEIKIFNDSVARAILTDGEYHLISESMASGIGFFHPSFVGDAQQALRWIVDNYLSPTPLARAAFAESSLGTAARIGASQYLIFAAGYDTFAYRQPDWAKPLTIFEIDHPATAADKMARLQRATAEIPENARYVNADFTSEGWQTSLLQEKTFSSKRISFCSLLGLSYYLTAEQFKDMIAATGDFLPKGSSLVFDYPDQDAYTNRAGKRARKQAQLAGGTGEAMLASYSYKEMERLLSDSGFLIYEHLAPDEMTKRFFAGYNKFNPQYPMYAFDNVNYCLAVKN